jgi:hypothetical protein
MATLETQILDEVIVRSRRKMLALGGTALAGMFLAGTETAKAASYSDTDILNFALNLEYLEANFYYLCAFGITIDATPNTASLAAGAPQINIKQGITGGGSQGTVAGTGMGKVPFGTTASEIAIAAYCNETAAEEGKHVKFLQTALGASTGVVMPPINLGVGTSDAFGQLAAALSPAQPGFSPYANSSFFLLGAYIFEDVGVTAYHGAAPLITTPAYLSAAAGILGVEAYHAGLIRTTIFSTDAANGNTNLSTVAQSISTLRNTLAQQVLATKNTAVTLDPAPDDFGPEAFNPTTGLGVNGVTSLSARIVDADTTDTVNPIPLAIAFSRTTSQVLNIVTGGASATGSTLASPAKGVFFPNGMNGLFR